MTQHVAMPPHGPQPPTVSDLTTASAVAAAPASARRAELFLLDQCRRLAGARATGAAVPADRVLADLRAVLSEAEACRVFGQLYALIARIDREAGTGFLWYPAGATRQSPDEARLIAAAHRIVGGPPGDGGPLDGATFDALPPGGFDAPGGVDPLGDFDPRGDRPPSGAGGDAARSVPADEPSPVGRRAAARPRPAAARLLPETYCAAADTFCGLLTLTGHACPVGCPVQTAVRAPGGPPSAGVAGAGAASSGSQP